MRKWSWPGFGRNGNLQTGEEVLSCTILTCGPNAVMGELHNRMPVILAPEAWPVWLGEETSDPARLNASLIAPIAA